MGQPATRPGVTLALEQRLFKQGASGKSAHRGIPQAMALGWSARIDGGVGITWDTAPDPSGLFGHRRQGAACGLHGSLVRMPVHEIDKQPLACSARCPNAARG